MSALHSPISGWARRRSGGDNPLLLVIRRLIAGLWPFIAVVAVWQLWVSLGHVSAVVAPSPETVASTLYHNRGLLGTELKYTAGDAALGLVVGMALGIALAVGVWASSLLSGLVTPGALLVQSFPIVAMIPIIARVMGYDVKTVITIVIIISFFSTFVLTRAGLDRQPAGAEDVFRVIGANRRSVLLRLALPSAIPNVFIALRLTATNCILSALVGEFLMGTHGLGYVIALSEGEGQLPMAFAAAALAAIISIAAFLAASSLELRVGRKWS